MKTPAGLRAGECIDVRKEGERIGQTPLPLKGVKPRQQFAKSIEMNQTDFHCAVSSQYRPVVMRVMVL